MYGKTLDIMKAIDTEVYGFVKEIEWYRYRYLGTAKALVVSDDSGVVVGYAAFVGLKPKAYRLMSEGYISGISLCHLKRIQRQEILKVKYTCQ